MRLITWNVARRTGRADQQAAFLTGREADVLALQEVTHRSYARLAPLLDELGFIHRAVSLAGAKVEGRGRNIGVALASRFSLRACGSSGLRLPWSEKGLSGRIKTGRGEVEVHTVHLPPGSSNGWVKIDHFEAIYEQLAVASERPRILCGDFNSPQFELPDGKIVTWASGCSRTGRSAVRPGGADSQASAGPRGAVGTLRAARPRPL